MTYNDWITELKQNLLSVSDAERRRVMDYYAEAYADRRAAGFSENEIIDGFGAPYDAAQAILENDMYAEITAKNSIQVDKSKKQEPAPLCSSNAPSPSPSPSPALQKNKGSAKKIALISVTAVVAFILVFVLPAIVIVKSCNFITKKLSEYDYELQYYNVSAESIYNIEIRIDYGQFMIYEATGEEIIVTYPTADGITNNATVDENGTLTFSRKLSSKYNYVNMPDTIIYVPKGFEPNLNVVVNAGNIEIKSGSFGEVNITVNAGQVVAHTAHCSSLNIELNAGNASIEGITATSISAKVNFGNLKMLCPYAESQYNTTVNVNLGNCNISSKTNPNAERTLYCNVDMGNLTVYFVD